MKIRHITFLVLLTAGVFSCTKPEISEEVIETHACCGEDDHNPPPPPGGGGGGG